MENIIATLTLFGSLSFAAGPKATKIPDYQNLNPLAEHQIWARKEDVGEVLRDNILLELHYLKGDAWSFANPSAGSGQDIASPNDLDWEGIRKPFNGYFILEEGEVFCYHPEILPEFAEEKIVGPKVRFTYEDGFKTYGGLPGNGVCYLASLINWVAKEAGLETTAKVNHDFYPVPGVPREYGVAIYYLEDSLTAQEQNLYIRNNFGRSVLFIFVFDGEKVSLAVY